MVESPPVHRRCSETSPTHLGFVTCADEELVWNSGLAVSFPYMMLLTECKPPPPPPPPQGMTYRSLLTGMKGWDVSSRGTAFVSLGRQWFCLPWVEECVMSADPSMLPPPSSMFLGQYSLCHLRVTVEVSKPEPGNSYACRTSSWRRVKAAGVAEIAKPS